MAVRVAWDLRRAGERVHVVHHDSLAPLFADLDVPRDVVRDHLGVLAGLVLDDCVRRLQPASIVHFDLLGTASYLRRTSGRDAAGLLAYDCPTLTLDTWHSRVTGTTVDAFGDVAPLAERPDLEVLRRVVGTGGALVPVPCASPGAGPGAFACTPAVPQGSRRSVRRSRRPAATPKRVLFCTSRWQHISPLDRARGRLVDIVPLLLSHYLREFGSAVRLVHVGPAALDVRGQAAAAYEWHKPVGRADFAAVVRSADLVVTANISATSIASAIAFEVPVLVLHNPHQFDDVSDLKAMLGDTQSPELLRACAMALPIYPFHVWPLGYRRFLEPLLRGNPYAAALCSVDLFAPGDVRGALHGLLFERAAAAAAVERQGAYAAVLGAVPRAAEAVLALVAGASTGPAVGRGIT